MNSRSTTNSATKCCGTCKWLDVPAGELTKQLRTFTRNDFMMYRCTVPFELPPFPARYRVELVDQHYTCPAYGTNCHFHELRTA